MVTRRSITRYSKAVDRAVEAARADLTAMSDAAVALLNSLL